MLLVLQVPLLISAYFGDTNGGATEPNSGNVLVGSDSTTSVASPLDISYLSRLGDFIVDGFTVGLNYDLEEPLSEGGDVYVNDGNSIVKDSSIGITSGTVGAYNISENETLDQWLSVDLLFPVNNSIFVFNDLNSTYSVQFGNVTNVSCALDINGAVNISNFFSPGSVTHYFSLGRGIYPVFVSCTSDNVMNATLVQYFEVETNFSLEVIQGTYYSGSIVPMKLVAPAGAAYSLKIILPSGSQVTPTLTSPFYNYTAFDPFNATSDAGLYRAIATFTYFGNVLSIENNFTVVELPFAVPVLALSVALNDTNITVNEPFEVAASVVNASGSIVYTVSYGDNASDSITSGNTAEKFAHQYANNGSYSINVSAVNNGTSVSSVLQASVSPLVQSEGVAPVLALLIPENNAEVGGNVQFSYTAFDNSTFHCNLSLSQEAPEVGANLYRFLLSRFVSNLQHRNNISESASLSAGKYSWLVKCTDQFNNSVSSADFFFTVKNESEVVEIAGESPVQAAENQSEEDIFAEIDKVIDEIDLAINAVQGLSDQQRKVAILLKLDDELIAYKRLAQGYKRDINNVKFRRDLDEDAQEALRQDLFDKAMGLRKEVPKALEVYAQEDYIKYDLANPLGNVTSSYLQFSSVKLTPKQFELYVKAVEEHQKSYTFSAEIYGVDVTYLDDSKGKVTVVKKVVKPVAEKVVEVLPKEITESADEIKFIQEIQVIEKDPIVEIKPEEGGYLYIINKVVDVKDAQNIDSLVFPDPEETKNAKQSLFTGAAIFSGGVDMGLQWVIIILALLVLGGGTGYYLLKDRLQVKEDHPGVTRLESLILDARRFIELNQMDKVEVLYEELKGAYQELPPELKTQFYPALLKIYGEIDSSYLFNLLIEANVYLKNDDPEKALELYEVVQDVYRRLPEDKKRLHYTSCVELLKKLEG